MKKFLQVSGWILVVFVCFYLFGLGERTPRKVVDERMDSIEERMNELENRIGERLSELSGDLEEISGEYADPLYEVQSELEDESWERRSADDGMWEEIQELRESIDELRGILEELHPDAMPEPAVSAERNSETEEIEDAWWDIDWDDIKI